MSRIGEKAIHLPDGVAVTVSDTTVTVKGGSGELTFSLPQGVSALVGDNSVSVSRLSDVKSVRQLHGTVRSRIANMVVGVSRGFEKRLEIQGVGYRAQIQGKQLNLSLGKSHPVVYQIPDGVDVSVETNTKVTVRGIDKETVGAVAAKIRSFYPPEPYKGKGIRYQGEHVRRKAGKTVAT